MRYYPHIPDYKPFYIYTDELGISVNLLTTNPYVIVKSPDYPSIYKAKEPYKNSWRDEHGDEEYIGDNGLYFEAFTLNFECAMMAIKTSSSDTEAAMIANIKSRMDPLYSILREPSLKIHDTYTGYGFGDVRLVEIQRPSSGNYIVRGDAVVLIFNIVLKVNDPFNTWSGE